MTEDDADDIAPTAAEATPDPPATEHELAATARLLLAEIVAVRGELERASEALRDRGAEIARALDELLDLAAPAHAIADDPVAGEDPAPDPAATGDEPRPPAPDTPDPATLADARLVALDMALGGSTRDEIEAELAARFELPDPAGLAGDVLAALG